MRRQKKQNLLLILVILVLSLGLGYAYLTTTLSINGTTDVDSNTWNVYWDNVQVTSGSVSGNQVTQAPTISNSTNLSFHIRLKEPGEYYEFTVDAKNTGSIDAMIDTIESRVNGNPISELPAYLKYSLTYVDDLEIEENHLLTAGTTETYKVRLEYNEEINPGDLPNNDRSLRLLLSTNYIQASTDGVPVPRPSFENDDWDDIISNLINNNACDTIYPVGSTKEINLENFGTHTVRLANCSTPTECSDSSFSQTACGIVLEFSDIITSRGINASMTNAGGWRDCTARTYLNSNVYNALPPELKNHIIDTKVVSGCEAEADGNYITTDKLYLLDAKELYGSSYTDSYNTAKNKERQLDYYESIGVTTSNLSGFDKYSGTTKKSWWLRSADNYNDTGFFLVNYNSSNYTYPASYSYGISPAFRLA